MYKDGEDTEEDTALRTCGQSGIFEKSCSGLVHTQVMVSLFELFYLCRSTEPDVFRSKAHSQVMHAQERM